jgi:mono/diheme cytochrome c family protein
MAMRIATAALLAVLAAPALVRPVWAETPIALKSFSVTLPDGMEMFAGGAAADVVNNNCLTCHSREMVTVQPALSGAAWTATVEKMRKVYKAPITDEDAAAIVRYLTATKGAK